MSKTLDVINWPVKTERLSLRPVESADVGALWRYCQLPEVTQWITNYPATLGDFRTMFFAKDYPLNNLAVELESENGTSLVGAILMRLSEARF